MNIFTLFSDLIVAEEKMLAMEGEHHNLIKKVEGECFQKILF